jgi:superfamily II DNA or RNA helicase
MNLSVGDPSSAGLEALSLLRAAATQAGAGPLAAQLAERALRVTERADFAVAQDALDALLRRLAAARDAGVVLSGPRRRPLGWFRVGRRRRDAPHYHVLLTALEPLEGSCSCPDFAKASLGLCKHLFLVAEGRESGGRVPDRPALRWDPVRPLNGVGDWLERLTWCSGSAPSSARERRARALFRAGDAERAALPPGVISDPSARRSAVEALVEAVRAHDRLAEPAILPLLERERSDLARMESGAIAARDVRRHCDGLKQKLFLYQREGVRRFLERGRLLLADDMGLGKTAQAIAACHVLVASGRVRRGLIVVPAPLKSQWQDEWRRFTDVPLTLVEGRPDERARTVGRAGAAMLLVNYEQVLRDLPQLLRFGPEVVVLDEAQRIKNWATKTAAHIKQLDPRWRLVLTGTPMENRLDELASIMEWVDESALEPRWRLPSWHAAWDAEGRTIIGARNLETLRQRLAPSMMRRVRREVIDQLPARRDTRVSVPLTAGQRAVHDDLNQPIARILRQAGRRPLAQTEFLRLMSLLTRQRILCNGLAQADFPEVWPTIERRRPTPPLLDSLASPKLAELRELIAAIAVDQERKVVVFSQWRRMLRLAAWAVSDVLRGAGVRAVFFTGEESARRRNQNVSDFLQDDDVRVLFATDAGGVGLNLQRAASCCVHLDLPWNPAVLEQRSGRIYRIGQERPVEIYTMVADDGLEGRVAALVGDKQALFSGLFDGASDTVEFERAGSFLARLQSVLTPDGNPDESDALDDVAEPARDPVDSVEDDARDEVTAVDGARSDLAAPAGGATPVAIASLLGQIVVRELADGRVSLEAPASAAVALAELFQGVAQLLTRTAPANGTGT